MKTSAEIIKELRLKHNLTQEELEEMIGVKKAAIHKYESGLVKNLKRSTIQKLADIFNVAPQYIMGWTNMKNLRIIRLNNKLTQKKLLNF